MLTTLLFQLLAQQLAGRIVTLSGARRTTITLTGVYGQKAS